MKKLNTSLTIVACITISSFAAAQTAEPVAAPGTAPSAAAQPAPAPAPVPTSTTTTTSSSLTSSSIAPVEPALAGPEASTTTSIINRPLMITGLVIFGGTYGASVIDGAVSNREGDKNYLYYPVVGPWMDYVHRGCDASPCSNETGNKALLILDGVGQGIGALAVITSLFIPEKTTKAWYLIGDRSVHAAPSRVGTGYGFGAAGVF